MASREFIVESMWDVTCDTPRVDTLNTLTLDPSHPECMPKSRFPALRITPKLELEPHTCTFIRSIMGRGPKQPALPRSREVGLSSRLTFVPQTDTS